MHPTPSSPALRFRPQPTGSAFGTSSKSKVVPLDDAKRFAKTSRALDVDSSKALAEVAQSAAKREEDSIEQRTRADKVTELAAGITKPERALLLAAPCPVFATAQRIQRSIITRLHAGGMRAPPPIISRIFQEVSNGCVAASHDLEDGSKAHVPALLYCADAPFLAD